MELISSNELSQAAKDFIGKYLNHKDENNPPSYPLRKKFVDAAKKKARL